MAILSPSLRQGVSHRLGTPGWEPLLPALRGLANTKMLFTVCRYVPNLSDQDGSAMERLIESRFQFGEVTP